MNMQANRRGLNMVIPTIMMGIIALILVTVGYQRGQGQHITGIKSGMSMVLEIIPLLIFAFIISGMVRVLIPHDLISKFIGKESGIKGILIGTMVGGCFPGGPYVSMPIAAGLLRSGASIGTVVAFLTGWSLWAISRLPIEIGILGWRLTLIRIASTFFFPPIAGLIAQTLFGGAK